MLWFILEMGSDLTRAYFWRAVNKRPICLWPGYFLTKPEKIFFEPKGKKMKNLTFLGEIFQTQTIRWLTKPDPVQIFWPRPITTAYRYFFNYDSNPLNSWYIPPLCSWSNATSFFSMWVSQMQFSHQHLPEFIFQKKMKFG